MSLEADSFAIVPTASTLTAPLSLFKMSAQLSSNGPRRLSVTSAETGICKACSRIERPSLPRSNTSLSKVLRNGELLYVRLVQYFRTSLRSLTDSLCHTVRIDFDQGELEKAGKTKKKL